MCSRNYVQRIVTAMMLYENIRDKLDKDGILRPIAKNSDNIWQQMTLENFDKLLKNKSLYMKAHSEYRDYDEKKLQQYIETCFPSNDKDKESLYNKLTNYENQMYISCWYSSNDLSDVVFKQYTGNSGGIAIGTEVNTLIDCLNSSISVSEDETKTYKYFVGNIQYIYHKELTEEKIFENTQIICPMFIKGIQFKADNEFRVCVFKNLKDESDIPNTKNIFGNVQNNLKEYIRNLVIETIENNSNNITEILTYTDSLIGKINNNKLNIDAMYLKGMQLEKLIKRIAFKDDGIYALLNNKEIKNIVDIKFSSNNIGLKVKDIESSIIRANGFIRCELEETIDEL